MTTAPPPTDRLGLGWRERVVIRHRIDDPTGRYKFADVKGFIQRVDGDGVLFRPETPGAAPIRIPLAMIEAAKPIPPRPVRRGTPTAQLQGHRNG